MNRSNVQISLAWLALALLAPAALAAAPDKPPSPLNQPRQLALDRAAQLDDELAALLQRRLDAAPAMAVPVDLQIDLRIVARQCLQRSAEAAPESDLAAAGYLRAVSVLSAAQQINQLLGRNGGVAPAQLEALKALHQLTYKAAEYKSLGQLDDLCKQVGGLLLTAGGPVPGQPRELPLMRPLPIERPQAASGATQSLAELVNAARQAAVSPGLRKELAALAADTSTAAADRARQDEASALYDMLGRAVALARGLQQGGLVEPDARSKIETQLTDGLALFLDVRTRSAGKAKVDQLGKYRQMLDRVRQLNLPPALQEKLTPAFGWAQRHVDKGPEVLEAIEQYLDVCARHDARKAPALPGVQQRVLDEQQKRFADQRQGFISDASQLSDGTSILSMSPDQLRTRLAAIGAADETIELIDQVPAALAAMAPYKPRPTGGLDRRAMISISALGGVVSTPTPDQARKFLQALRTMAHVAGQLTVQSPVPTDVEKVYADGRLALFNGRRADRVAELASLAAAGKELDRDVLARLDASQSMVDALADAAAAEAALKRADVLGRWVDWSVPPEALDGTLRDFRTGLAGAFDAFADGDLSAVDRLPALRQRAQPMVGLIKTVGMYADQCKDLPTGWTGELAKLMTPMDRQPFAIERYVSFMFAVMDQPTTAPGGSGTDAAAFLDAMLSRLKRD